MKITFKVGSKIYFGITVKAPIGRNQSANVTRKDEDNYDNFYPTRLPQESPGHQPNRSGHWRSSYSLINKCFICKTPFDESGVSSAIA